MRDKFFIFRNETSFCGYTKMTKWDYFIFCGRREEDVFERLSMDDAPVTFIFNLYYYKLTRKLKFVAQSIIHMVQLINSNMLPNFLYEHPLHLTFIFFLTSSSSPFAATLKITYVYKITTITKLNKQIFKSWRKLRSICF